MRQFNLLLAAIPLCLLAGCGNSGLDGKYQATTSVMGFNAGSQTVEFSSGYIIAGGNKIKVDEWERKDDVVVARDKNGNALINVKVFDGGKRLESVGSNDMAKQVFVRVD
jgi:hypothetical protein